MFPLILIGSILGIIALVSQKTNITISPPKDAIVPPSPAPLPSPILPPPATPLIAPKRYHLRLVSPDGQTDTSLLQTDSIEEAKKQLGDTEIELMKFTGAKGSKLYILDFLNTVTILQKTIE